MSWILLIGALLVSFLVFTFLVKVLRAAVSTAIALALVVLVLQILFGINPGQVWQAVTGLWENLQRMMSGN
jgi:succinate-acetate transporter protein